MSLSGTLQGNGITATLQAALPGPSAPTLTAVGWPASFVAESNSNETAPPLRIDGATSPQTLRMSVSLPGINDSVDIYSIYVYDSLETSTGEPAVFYSVEAFNAANGQLVGLQSLIWIMCDYTGSEMLPRTITVTLTHLERNAVVGSFDFTFNPAPA